MINKSLQNSPRRGNNAEIFFPVKLPAYAYLPDSGLPHPTRHPQGHSFGHSPAVSETDWETGMALFAAGYYWEAHEAWEGLWRQAVGLDGQRLRGMIQLAAALLKLRQGNARGAASLWAKSRALLIAGEWRGLDLVEWVARYDSHIGGIIGPRHPH